MEFGEFSENRENTFLATNSPIPHGDWSVNLPKVRSQHSCGSCWAIAATEAVEAAYSIQKRVDPVQLSAQQILNCSTLNNFKCSGGFVNQALKYIQQNGIQLESDLPYTSGESGEAGECNYDPSKAKVHMSGYEYCSNSPNFDEPKPCTPELFGSLLQRGPVATRIDAASRGFSSYQTGIWEPTKSDCHSMNHAVIIVGFGVDEQKNVEYLMVRNSWGEEYGEHGVIRIKYYPDDPTYSCFASANAYSPIIQ